MSLGEEVVGIHTCSEHCSYGTGGLVRLDSGCENYQISVDMELLVSDKVRCLNIKISVRSGGNLSDHTLYVVNAVLFNSSAVELIEELTGSTDINVEYINVCIGIFFSDKHCVLSGVHTADLGAVGLSAAVVRSGAYALNENDGLGVSSVVVLLVEVGRSYESTVGRTCGIHKSFKLERSDNVLALGICELIVLVDIDGVVTGSGNDCAVLFLNDLVLLSVVDSACGAYLGANAALACLEHCAVVGVNGSDLGNCLSKRNVDGTSVIEAHIELVGYLLLRALFCADTAACALGSINETSFLSDLCGEVSYEA